MSAGLIGNRRGPLRAVRRQLGKPAVRWIDEERGLSLWLAIISPVIARLSKEGIVRVCQPAFFGKLSELFVGQRGFVAEAGGALERNAQHGDARPVSL